MKRTLTLGIALLSWLGCVSASQAQVTIRVPFVRIQVGDGVSVRAPFVNIYVPPAGPTYGPAYGPVYGPRLIGSPEPPLFVPPTPTPELVPIPAPKLVQPVLPTPEENAPPQPVQPVQVLNHRDFAKTFQPRAGAYEVTMLNPVTRQPTAVRFLLPGGQPRRISVGNNYIEFVYDMRQFVRIEFDRDGARVISR